MLNKLKAFLIHLGISIFVLVTVLLLCLFAWYPEFYFAASSTKIPIYTMIFVDIGIGPLLTFIIYKQGKPGLLFDLSMIALFQIAALLSGIWVIYSERPVLTVYHQGYFYCLNSAFVTGSNADINQFSRIENRVPNVFLPEAATEEEKQRRDKILAKMPRDQLPPPHPAFVFGEQFKPIEKADVAKMLYDEVDITQAINSATAYQERWKKFETKHPDALKNYAFFPLICSAEEHLAATDRNTGQIVDAVEIPTINAIKKRFLTPPVSTTPTTPLVDPLKPVENK